MGTRRTCPTCTNKPIEPYNKPLSVPRVIKGYRVFRSTIINRNIQLTNSCIECYPCLNPRVNLMKPPHSKASQPATPRLNPPISNLALDNRNIIPPASSSTTPANDLQNVDVPRQEARSGLFRQRPHPARPHQAQGL